jgi:ABC-type tungstate transport system substrate-binding protein
VLDAQLYVKVNVADDPALTVPDEGDIVTDVRFVDDVPIYAVITLPLVVPVFLMTTAIDPDDQDMFSLVRNTPACCVCVPVNVITHAYVTMTAATAITINRSVARIGEIPFFDFNILFKT